MSAIIPSIYNTNWCEIFNEKAKISNCDNKWEPLITLLKMYQTPTNTLAHMICKQSCDDQLIIWVFESGLFDLEIYDDLKHKPIHYLSKRKIKSSTLIKILSGGFVDIEAVCNKSDVERSFTFDSDDKYEYSNRPSHLLCKYNRNPAIIHWIFKSGVLDVEVENEAGMTPLEMFIDSNENIQLVKTISLLMKEQLKTSLSIFQTICGTAPIEIIEWVLANDMFSLSEEQFNWGLGFLFQNENLYLMDPLLIKEMFFRLHDKFLNGPCKFKYEGNIEDSFCDTDCEWSYQLTNLFVEFDGNFIKHLHITDKTLDLCKQAYRTTPSCIRYIPKEFHSFLENKPILI
jgi:hypothetical protein